MKTIIFDTPVIKTILKQGSRLGLWLVGWKAVDERTKEDPRFVMVIAPHTSNWDFVLIYMFAAAVGVRGHWLGKHTLFKGPFRPIFLWMGGIPVVRSRSANLVDQCVKAYNDDPRVMLAVTPEGTRKKVDRWRTGFYHIAVGASVPIALGFLDYRLKEAGIAGMYHPTGEMEKDVVIIRAFYRDITPKNPQNFDPGPELPPDLMEK